MQLCAVSSFYPHGIKKRWRWGECWATEHLCPLDSWNRQWHPSRTCPQWCQLPHTDCSFCCVHAQLDTQCTVSRHKKSTGSSYGYACASAFNMVITWDVPVHFACLCAYFHAQTALLIIQMVQFWSSVVITVRNINTTCFSLTVCNVSACALLVPSYSCLESISEGKFLKTVYVLGMLHPWSTGAAAEQSYGRSMALTSVLCTCMLTFKQEWGAGQSLFQGNKWQDQTKQPQTVSGEA